MSINNMLINGDSLDKLKLLPDNSVDLIVTDPPYGYSFMGKAWDKALPDKRIWKECLRVLKAGGFAYIMSAPRQDVLARMMIDLEDTGFKTDFTSMYWAYATGFPKAMNMSKAIDKKLGVEREVVGKGKSGKTRSVLNASKNPESFGGDYDITESTSDKAKKLDGSYAGFQPKPAVEVIIVCMKPLEEKGYTDQALANGKGVSWFDDCRIPTGDSDKYDLEQREVSKAHGIQNDDSFLDKIHDADAKHGIQEKGRYPANLLVSDNAVDIGEIKKSNGHFNSKVNMKGHTLYEGGFNNFEQNDRKLTDSGDFSRYYDLDRWWESQFIITPKASKSEKNKGTKNNHPTVKPLKLMSYLITLGSREGDIVLDPFMGSGTTPLASKNLNRKYIGIEREEEYFKICCARVGDDPTILEDKKEPLKEIKLEEVKSVEVSPPTPEEFICSICGVNYYGTTYQEHEKKPFHQGYI